MTTGSAELTELEAQRAELETLLSSREFTRAPKLAQLLSYLCERLFAGEANQIKEYSIGLEVFHRGASFDQDSDSIVRVEANRLRRRLAEYYAGEGASHSLRITIPVGQYVPRFEPVTPQTVADSPGTIATEPQPDISPSSPLQNLLRPHGPRPWWMFTVMVFVICNLLVDLLYGWLDPRIRFS